MILALPVTAAAEGPQPPCRVSPEPVYGPADQAPSRALFSESELTALGWMPPPCLGWQGRTRLVAAIAGEFSYAGGMDELLGRLGAFSQYPAIRYWSVSHRSWRPLAEDAGLLAPTPGQRDLTAGLFVAGAHYDYFEIGQTGRTTYRLSVRERDARHAVVALENTSAIRLLVIPLFDPGALQTVIFLERHGEGHWRYYQIMRAGGGAGLIALSAPASYLNRLLALYGYVSGIPAATSGWRQE